METEKLTTLVFDLIMGYGARQADIQIVATLEGQGIARHEAIADLVWDHHMGEPEDPSRAVVEGMIRTIERRWPEMTATMTEAEAADALVDEMRAAYEDARSQTPEREHRPPTGYDAR